MNIIWEGANMIYIKIHQILGNTKQYNIILVALKVKLKASIELHNPFLLLEFRQNILL